jgi:6-phosphogluconolactonase
MKFTVFNTIKDISIHITDKLSNLLENNSETISIALSGGNTPKALFIYWTEVCKEKIDWQRIRFYWVDERCVPSSSDESNYGVAKRIMFDKLAINPNNVFAIDGQNSPEQEIVFQSERILKNLPIVNGLPQFDLILLGMGNDGHTASIFPNQLELLQSKNNYDIGIHPQTGQKRITLTGPVLQNAKNVFFMVTGVDKATVFNEILLEKDNWQNYPASHIIPVGNCEWLIDKAVLRG